MSHILSQFSFEALGEVTLTSTPFEAFFWCLSLAIFLMRFMTVGLKVDKKFRNPSILITEQVFHELFLICWCLLTLINHHVHFCSNLIQITAEYIICRYYSTELCYTSRYV